jgi:hypothetical protein
MKEGARLVAREPGWPGMSPRLAGTRGGRGGETEGPALAPPSSLHSGDMFDPETDMFGEVAGELVMN